MSMRGDVMNAYGRVYGRTSRDGSRSPWFQPAKPRTPRILPSRPVAPTVPTRSWWLDVPREAWGETVEAQRARLAATLAR